MKYTPSLMVVLVLLLFGCMDEGKEYDECLRIETARCELRDRCEGDYAKFDLDQCIYYYTEQCRAREIDADFTDAQLNACVADIDALGTEEQCGRLDDTALHNEICRFAELSSCREFLCITDDVDEEEPEDTEEPTDTDTDSDVPSGLDPS